ncbi:B12-binding domain-containing radical SAM protein [Methanospirillum lacunae]|uniref:Uncharacterized protein n=1 Tax=Methanospirillum lacunae TaxID=668570 RepID=A0A2V2NC18_9EURY|nr:radical SAM protein [Methanospirillum lacunae]PWR72853.1 hypothetical protein DK846_07855 [Methanospirillum lacunae]
MILAINPQWNDEYRLSFPLGIATIVSIVKHAGYDISVIDFDANRTDNPSESLNCIPRPEIILLTGMITTYKRVRYYCDLLKKKWPESYIIVGGGLATTAPDEILKRINADIYVIGEGDEIILPLIDSLLKKGNLAQVKGIKYNNNGTIFLTPPLNPPDISKTPSPAYDLFPMDKYIKYYIESGLSFEMYCSKGCPYRCNYCYHISGHNVRYRNVDDVIADIRMIKTKYGLEKVSFEDDNFTTNKKWIEEFCLKVKPLHIKFRFQASIQHLTEELLEMLKDAGLSGISMGIESGSPQILKELNKNIQLEKVERILKWLKDYGIQYNATFIVGSISENPETIELTKQFLIRNGFKSNYQVFFMTLYPRTTFYEYAVKKSIIDDEIDYIENLKLQNEISVNLTQYSDEILRKWYRYLKNL